MGHAAAGAKPGAPRVVRLTLEYDGEAFAGWQRQPRDRSVQAEVEGALRRLLGASIPVIGAGRTDAGVHARAMVASFQTTSAMPAREMHRALDALLPEDVGVLSVRDEREGFHALADARWKWYRYRLLLSRERRVHERRTSWRVGGALDVDAMKAASAALLGRRDFAAFQAAGSPRRSTVRTVVGTAWTESDGLLAFDVVADGFLYGMVRAFVGTLVDVGRGRRDPASIEALLASKDRRRAGPAAPGRGLCLMAVGYAGDDPPPFVDRALAGALESERPSRRSHGANPDHRSSCRRDPGDEGVRAREGGQAREDP